MQVGRRSVLGLGLAAGLAGGAAAAPAPRKIDVEGKPTPALLAALSDIADYAARHVESYGLPGLTVALVMPDATTAVIHLGYAAPESRTPVGPDHLFQIGSISKAMTALAIHRLAEAGKLNLDDDVAGLLPGVPLPAGGGIQVRHLLDHTSGLPDDAPIFPRGGDQRLWQGFAPGSRWSYSNLGYMLLSEIVARKAGRPFPDALQDLVLTPLGLGATRPAILSRDRARYAEPQGPLYIDRPHPRAAALAPAPWVDMTEGSGCVASTGRDMARYMRWVLRAASGGDAQPLLSKAAAARLFGSSSDAPGWAKGARYGSGWAHVLAEGRPLLHHTGGMIGYSSSIHLDPAAGVGGFASSNVGGIDYRPRQVTAYACQRLRAALEGAKPSEPPPAPPILETASDYVGTWTGSNDEGFTIAARDGALILTMEARPYRLEPIAEDAFMPADASASMPLVFKRDAKAVVRAWWGGVEYLPARAGAVAGRFSPPTPEHLRRLVGTYESDDPWRGVFHVVAQGPDLTLDGLMALTPLPGGGYRAGAEDWSPERLAFDAEIDGLPTRATFSGADFIRRPV